MADTVDLAVVGAFAGRGRRAGTYGALLMAAYDANKDLFKNWLRCMNLNLRKSQVNVPPQSISFPCFGVEDQTPLKKAKPFYQSIREMRGVLYKSGRILEIICWRPKARWLIRIIALISNARMVLG